ncbi:MAG TPA: tetratricopeptide repeat protein [Pyrinomonadaceae bacterium]|nr:tetratricopeptide repeat protein [Pyrinomonadaceae bacterium]
MEKHPLAVRNLIIAFILVLSFSAAAYSQSGGGTVGADPVGGAALIFRKPRDPDVRPSSASVGGSATTGRRTRTPVQGKSAAQDRIIAKGNAARSAATPRYSEAELHYKEAAREDPNDPRAHAGLGNVYLDQGRFNNAIESYREALKARADYLDAYQPLGYSLARLNRHNEATDVFKQALQYDSDNAEIYNNLAFTLVHAERYPEAVEAAEKAIVLLGQTGQAFKQGLQNRNEVLSHAYKNIGNAYNGMKKYNEAADALKQAAGIEPNNAAAHFNLGLALYNGGRFSEAIEAYQAVLKLRPQLAAAHYNLGLTYVAINDKQAARRQYEILKPLNANMADQLQKVIR